MSRPVRAGHLIIAVASVVLACASSGCGSPGVAPSVPSGGSPAASPAPTGSAAPPAPPSPEARWVRLEWRPVETPILKPRGGFEHRFLTSARGMLVMITNLEGEPTTLVGTSADGASWKLASVGSGTLPAGREINGGADWLQLVHRSDGQGGQELVASRDGLAWEPRGRLPSVMPVIQEAVADGDTILACGSRVDGRPACSLSRDAGRSWELVGDLTGLVQPFAGIRGLARLGAGWIAIVEGPSEGQARVLTSPDGTSWTLQPDPIRATPSGPAVVAQTAVVLGTDPVDPTRALMSASLDGVTWRTVPLARTTNPPAKLHRAGPALVALGTFNEPEGSSHVTDILVSADGWTWRVDSVPGPMRTWPEPMFFSVGDALLAIGPDAMMLGRVVPAGDPGPPPAQPATPAPVPSGAAPPVMTWTASPSSQEGEPSDVIAWGGGYVAVGWGSLPLGALGAVAWTSSDGLTWTKTLEPDAFPNTRMIAVAGRGSTLVAAGWEWLGATAGREERMAAAFWRSTDARAWERVPDRPELTIYQGMQAEGAVLPRLNDVVAGGPGFVAVGATSPGGATVWTSTDGWSWQRTTTLGEGTIEAVTAGGPGLVAVGTDGIWTSSDGLRWSKVTGPPEGGLSDVAANGSLLVSIGSGPAVWWSTDGRTWVPAPAQPALRQGAISALVGVSWGFVGLGSTTCAHSERACPAAWTSADGRRWEQAGLPPGEAEPVFNPVAAVATGDQVVAVGASHDLANWIRQDQGLRGWVGRPAP